VACMLSHPPVLLALRRRMGWVNRTCGVLLLLLGVRVLTL